MQTFLIVIAATLSLSLPNLTFAQNKSLKKNQASVSSKMNTKNGQSLNKLETLVPQLMKDSDVAGLSVTLIKNGDVFWHRGFGVKNADTKEPIADDTVFEAASLSKTVFAYAVLKMVEDRKLDLDASLW